MVDWNEFPLTDIIWWNYLKVFKNNSKQAVVNQSSFTAGLYCYLCGKYTSLSKILKFECTIIFCPYFINLFILHYYITLLLILKAPKFQTLLTKLNKILNLCIHKKISFKNIFLTKSIKKIQTSINCFTILFYDLIDLMTYWLCSV